MVETKKAKKANKEHLVNKQIQFNCRKNYPRQISKDNIVYADICDDASLAFEVSVSDYISVKKQLHVLMMTHYMMIY